MASSSTDPSPVLVFFARGVISRLAIWPTLTIAVTSSWGGPSSAAKRTWLASELVDAFEKSAQDGGEDEFWVEEMLLQVMEDEFNTGVEDGSALEVAKDVVKLWRTLSQPDGGGEQMVLDLEARADKIKGKRIEVQVEDEIRSDEEEEEGDWSDEDDAESDQDMESVPRLVERKPEPIVDDEGFTLVQGKVKKG